MQFDIQKPEPDEMARIRDKYTLPAGSVCACGNPIKWIVKVNNKNVCNKCHLDYELENAYKESVKGSTLSGTDYEGLNFDSLKTKDNKTAVCEIERIIKDDFFRIVIYGMNRGTGKTATGMVIKDIFTLKGKKVYHISLSELQSEMTTEGGDAYQTVSKYVYDCDILIIDEIDKYTSRTRFYLTHQFDIIEKRIKSKKPIILIGNVPSVHRPTGEQGGVYACDMFDADRLRDFDSFNYVGNSFRGRR